MVTYNFNTLKRAAIDTIREGHEHWQNKENDFFEKYTLIELVEWAMHDIFLLKIPDNPKHDILRAAYLDFRKNRSFRDNSLDFFA